MANKKTEKDFFVNPDGIKLFRLVYPPAVRPYRAVVFVCHDLFEHCQASYFKPVIRPLVNNGCLVITHDHQGHGLSQGERGMIYNFDSLVRDVLQDIDETLIKENIPQHVPLFIYGYSMGGLVSLYASLRRNKFFKGMCLEAPMLIFPEKIGKISISIGKLLSRYFPTFEVNKFDYDDLCRNKDYINSLYGDHLRIHNGVPIKTAMELFKAVDNMKGCLKDISTPFIIFHGNADEICEIRGSEYLMEVCPVQDKTLIIYQKAKHQLRMETENVNIEISKKLLEWILERAPS